jgi:acylphosphatase
MEPNESTATEAWRLVGRVQGVGFRWWTVRTATRLGLRGTVRNCPDGSVEIVAAGKPVAMRAFAALIADGPLGARVDRIESLGASGPLPLDFRAIS